MADDATGIAVDGVAGGAAGRTAGGAAGSGMLPVGAGISCLVVLQPASNASNSREWDKLKRINDMKDRALCGC